MRGTFVFLLFAVSIGIAQPAFEVTSVKTAVIPPGAPEHAQYHMTVTADASRVQYANATLLDLLRTAFRVDTYQMSGPAWMGDKRFDVLGKIPAGATAEQVPEMLVQLLTARFGLAFHRAKVEKPVMALTAGKGGPKLTGTPPDSDAPVAGGFSRSVAADGSMQMIIRRMSLSGLADLLGRFMDQPIADATGIAGSYDFTISFSAADMEKASRVAGIAEPGPPSSGDSGIGSSLDRYGLKLEGKRLPVDLIVIDHLERAPTAN